MAHHNYPNVGVPGAVTVLFCLSDLRHQPRAPLLRSDCANVADVLLVRELLAGSSLDEGSVERRLFGDLAYRSGELGEELAGRDVLLGAERANRRPTIHQQGEICFAVLKGVFGIDGTLANTLVGLVTRIAAKVVHLRALRHPAAWSSSRPHQGIVGLRSLQQSFSLRALVFGHVAGWL